MALLHRDKFPRSGFQGVREYRLVQDSRLPTDAGAAQAWEGLGHMVYLADARFVPHGQTQMHAHRGIDVVSVVLEGRLLHEGSLGQGRELAPYAVQVQCAGNEGFSHNEINPDGEANRIVQIWVLPERDAGAARYYDYAPQPGRATRVYGGEAAQADTVASGTCIDIVRLQSGQSLDVDKAALVYVCTGRCFANEDTCTEGTLLRAEQFTFDAVEDTLLILVHAL